MQGSCYKISSRKLNWNAAKTACEALGSKLVMVKSQSELKVLVQKVSRNIWIGLHRDPRDKSRWIWVDGTRLIYSHWQQGEPNNYGGYEGCLEMRHNTGVWNDFPCHYSMHYVCETNAYGEGTLISREISWHGMTKSKHHSCSF